MIPAADAFGPWARDILPAERLARLRSMRAIVRLQTGPRGGELADRLRQAEANPDALEPALAALNALAPIDRRHVLASFAALHQA